MTFGAPEWLWGLLLVPLLIAIFVNAEHRGLNRLQQFVSARLLPQLAGTVNRQRRIIRFALQLLGLALAIVSLAQPRWGYTFEDVKRKGLDLLIAVDTSRSMLSNDVQPSRLERVKLAIQDLVDELQGDRVGLIAFAGRSFLQAPLTIDYDAVIEAVNDLDTKTIPEGGTNISSAIELATQSFGKSAMGNRALIIFTDGEELSGDAVKSAKAAADAGVRIFTVGVGTPQGSLIPVTGDNGETSFVKDINGQVVKSKLDDKRLREVAEATGGFYLHLENGPRTMQQVQGEGLAKMQAAEMDVRLSRRPIERYEWPLGGALIALALSILIPERKRVRVQATVPAPARNVPYSMGGGPAKAAGAAAVLLILLCSSAFATVPGVNAYQQGKFEDAYKEFQDTLKSHPQSRAEDELQFDSGTAAYKLKDYNKALESFSQALLTPDTGLQTKGHYNLGNTLYQHGEIQKSDDKKLSDWTNALDHYEQTLKLDPQNKEAKDNYEYVKRKIDELKNKKEQQQPSPSPTPPQNKNQKKQDKQQNQKNQDQQQQQKDQQQKDQQQKNQKDQQQQQQQQQNQNQQNQKDQQQAQDQQSQNSSGNDKDQKQQQQKDQQQAKNEPQKKQEQQQKQPGESPSPSPGAEKQQNNQPSPSPGQRQAEQSPSPGEGENETASPSPGEGDEENASPTPAESPQKKLAGEVKGAAGDTSQKPADKNDQMATEAEQE
ncbi:MAG TPA: VWA domain-containing protein, partial [Candidatus Tectomicrobia bacterium]|nr:VWA domain-containing protein [Candidatus Tectomicrobia bacterium]